MNKNLSKLLFLLPSVFLFSCINLGPDVVERNMQGKIVEEFTLAETPNPQDEVDAKFDENQIKDWWKLLNDPILNSLIERAFKTNYDLEIARKNVEAARASFGMSVGGILPVLDTDGALKESGGGKNPTIARYNAGLSASWELDVFGGTRRMVESAGYDYLSSIFDSYTARLEVASEVANAYFSYRANCELLKITEENLKIQTYSYEVTEELVKHSFSSELDKVRAKAQLQTTTSQLPLILQKIRSSRHSLELLLGLKIDSLKDELNEFKPLPSLEKITPNTVPASLIKRRPDLISAMMKISGANAKIGEAYADYLPRFYITGNISYSAPTSANMFQNQYGSWSVGPTVSWNLFNGGRTYHNVRYQKALTEKAGLSFEKSAMTAIKEVQDNIDACAKSKECIELLEIAVESDIEAYKLSTELYESGSIKFLDLLESQRTLLNAQQSLLELRMSMISQVIALYKSLGGGWDFEKFEQNSHYLFEFKDNILTTSPLKK